MPRRSITDEEIGLIKAMLRRGMRNRDIQFYFNRQDRPVNSGRITNIRSGDYGPEVPEVPEATDAALDAYLATFTPAEVEVVIEGEGGEQADVTTGLKPINKTHLTLHSVSWPPATLRSEAPPNPTACESALETPDSGGRIGNRSSESLDSGSRGRSSRRRCSKNRTISAYGMVSESRVGN